MLWNAGIIKSHLQIQRNPHQTSNVIFHRNKKATIFLFSLDQLSVSHTERLCDTGHTDTALKLLVTNYFNCIPSSTLAASRRFYFLLVWFAHLNLFPFKKGRLTPSLGIFSSSQRKLSYYWIISLNFVIVSCISQNLVREVEPKWVLHRIYPRRKTLHLRSSLGVLLLS
jgi:hypothetical protein